MAVVVAHTDDETVSVRAEFAGGGVDQMDVIDHWAVLVDETPATGGAGIASQGTAATQGQASVFALSGNGTVLEEAELPGIRRFGPPHRRLPGSRSRRDRPERLRELSGSPGSVLSRLGSDKVRRHLRPAVSPLGGRGPSWWDKLSPSTKTAEAR